MRKTKVWKINDLTEKNSIIAIEEIATELKKGEIIAFPTETVYGLGANALDSEAVEKIFIAKGRPSDNPLIVHIASIEQLHYLTEEINETSMLLIERFWPGPLTIIFKRREGISELVTAGLDTVAVRMPNNPIALAIIKAANIPIAAPSANSSGKPSPTTAEHVINDLDGKVEGIVDGGPTGIGVESTVIDVSMETPIILRPGAITIEELRAVLGKVELESSSKNYEQPKSPGMKYRHYAPKGEMVIITGNENRVTQKINSLIQEQLNSGKSVGILTTEEHKNQYLNANLIFAYGNNDNMYPLAENLYDVLREFDKKNIDYIIIEGIDEEGIGHTIMNRLKKAANGNIINV
ncbi:MAG: L-threonylcarbamoyladenylate synthase [Vulcanibacillus sp.]